MSAEMNVAEESTNPLDRPADVASLRQLQQTGLLSDDAYRAARALVLPNQVWRQWASRHLLFYGTALLLAGIIYFFAYNWAEMGRFLKLGIVGFGILLCAGSAQVVGHHKLGGKLLILSASILVGVLLAVFGQVYQTGADAYELFVGWAFLIFVWVLVSEFAALWIVWLVILHCAAIFYWMQVAEPKGSVPFDIYFMGLAIADAAVLALREFFLHVYSREWLKGAWLRSVLVITFLFFLSMPVMQWIFESSLGWFLSIFAPLLWLIGVSACFYIYRYVFRDALPLTFLALDLCIVVCTFLIYGLFETLRMDDGGILLSGLIIILVVGGAAIGLKFLIAEMAKERAQIPERSKLS